MSGAVIQEKVICHAQHLNLIYSQADTLYNIIPHSPWYSNEDFRLALGPHVNGVVGSASSTATTQLLRKLGQLVLSDNPTKAALITTTTTSST